MGSESVHRAALAVLNQGVRLVRSLDSTHYSKACASIGGSTIGQHVRHALDHYSALLDGYESSQTVRYDQRERGTAIETDSGVAIERINVLRGQLGGLDIVQMEWPLQIGVMVSADEEEVEIESTMIRELAFVAHHAVHHWAMCRIACETMGIETDPALGRAPSTLANDRA
jgi:hypothetical protein